MALAVQRVEAPPLVPIYERDMVTVVSIPEQNALASYRAEQELESTPEYDALFARAQTANLKDIQELGFFSNAGFDYHGRAIVLLYGKNLPAQTADMERVLLFFIREMDRVTRNPKGYVIVYFHSMTTAANKIDLGWLKKSYNILPRRYKKNIQNLYVVHSSLWIRLTATFFGVFVSHKFWHKLEFIPTLEELFIIFNKKQIQVPDSIIEYQAYLNGE